MLETAYRCFLKYGIEQSSQERISRECGLSLRSVNRYFCSKEELVMQTSGWVGRLIRQMDGTSLDSMSVGGRSGIDILERFIRGIVRVYLDKPQLFTLKGEFDIYIFRHGKTREQGYHALWQSFDPQRMLARTFEIGYADGSIRRILPPETEARYCCNSLFSFMQNLSMLDGAPDVDSKKQLDAYVERTIEAYRSKSGS